MTLLQAGLILLFGGVAISFAGLVLFIIDGFQKGMFK